ncbi:hypothetical protein HZY91_04525 [Facklamia sp. DSM 111018]|uniref:Uncharacterized protein n=1 Tax=Facklamia lactis TaxID=2749967 RepID=A0ABS0LPT5_9LACT|nr:hypothetical protein [Facklamia lactis]MBG9986158.1 hypothetical protein [Facklamia lactis]
MQAFTKYIQNLDREFWIYNYLAAFIFWVFSDNAGSMLLLFPLAVAIIKFIITFYVNQPLDQRYVGFYPMDKDPLKVVVAVLINAIIFAASIPVTIIGLIYLWWKERP